MSDFNSENWTEKFSQRKKVKFFHLTTTVGMREWEKNSHSRKKEKKKKVFTYTGKRARNEKLLLFNWTHEKICKAENSI